MIPIDRNCHDAALLRLPFPKSGKTIKKAVPISMAAWSFTDPQSFRPVPKTGELSKTGFEPPEGFGFNSQRQCLA